MTENLSIILKPESVWKTTTPMSYTLNLPFYLLEWGHFIALDKYYTMRANSNRFLLFYTLNGCGKLIYDGKTYMLAPNTIAIIHCDTVHRYETFSKEPWDFLWFHYHGSAAYTYYNLYNENNLYIHNILPTDKEAELIKRIIACPSEYDFEKDLKISQLILDLMTRFILSKRDITREYSASAMEKLRDAIQYMSEHLTEKISIADISQSIFLSQYHFLRIFKKQMKITPYEYLIHLRINKVKELLVSTDECLDDIAIKSGFSDSKNLIYNFKRIEHITPNEYRKKCSLY